jgi:hypothetical protein
VHARLKLDFETERNAKARPRKVVTGRRRKLEMLGVADIRRRRDCGSELASENIGGGDAVFVVVFEVFEHDLALRIHNVGTWIWDAISEGPRLSRLVQNVEGADDLRIRV